MKRYSFGMVALLIFIPVQAGTLKSPIFANSNAGKELVNTPYGEFPHSGHVHAGYDIQNHGDNVAVVSGTIHFGYGSVNEVEIIPDDKTSISRIVYLHSKRFYVKEGEHVNAGQPISKAGGVGSGGSIHTHIEVIATGSTPVPQYTFSKKTGDLMSKNPVLGSFRTGKPLSQFALDPYPFFGVPMVFNPRMYGGKYYKKWHDTQRLYEAALGKATIGGISNVDNANIADELGVENPSQEQVSQFLFEQNQNTYGGSVEIFTSDEDISFSERLKKTSNFRFGSEIWAKSITSASNRALYADYVAANGLEVFLKNEIQKKRNHIEALFATLASQKIKEAKKNAIYAFNNSQSTNISNAIK